MVWIFSDSITQRLSYTLDFIFEARGVAYTLTNDPELFIRELERGVGFVYSDYPFAKEYPTISPAELLFEEEIFDQKISTGSWQGCECLLFTRKTDPVASVFYVLSRYEEYLEFTPDEHGRFKAKDSVQAKNGWLQSPICDYWSEAILKWLEELYHCKLNPVNSSELLLTFDIDNTYAFRYKNPIQLLGGRIKDFLTGNHQRMDLRRNVLNDEEKDPFDTFDTIIRLSESTIPVRVFWLLGDLHKYDRNVPWTQPFHQRLIRNVNQVVPVGIHPSYYSNTQIRKVSEERGRLEFILNQPVYDSRQHFLKIEFPGTFRRLASLGMKRDYSIGFADDTGFRLGTARPVAFYDLEKDEVTDLTLIPFVYMDGTLNQYLGKTPDEAKRSIENLVGEVKRYGGIFCCIWHNETIGETGIWKGWKEVLDYTISVFNS